MLLTLAYVAVFVALLGALWFASNAERATARMHEELDDQIRRSIERELGLAAAELDAEFRRVVEQERVSR